MNQVGVELRNLQVRQSAGDSAEFRANRLYRKLEEINGRSGKQQRNNRTGDACRKAAADDQRQQREHRQGSSLERQRVEAARQFFHAQPEHAGNLVEMQSEEIL